METLRAEVVEWITQPKAETGWLVARIVGLDGADVMVTGCGLPGPGSWVEVQGTYESHPRFGAQFRIRSVLSSQPPLSRDGVARWLRDRVAGVGAKTADQLLDLFGGAHELWAVAERGGAELARRGVKPAIAEAIAHAFAREGDDARFQALLNGWGMTQNQVAKVKKHWSLEQASSLLKANPYLLCDHIDGFGFTRADRVARASGMAHDAPARINAAVLHHLELAAGQGHVYGDIAVFMGIARATRLPVGRLAVAAGRLQSEGRLVVETDDKSDRVYLPGLHSAECAVAKGLSTRFAATSDNNPLIVGDMPESAAALTEEQQWAVALMLDERRRIVFVSGGPGTGKTTILRAALDGFEARGKRVQLAAPTGKAAKRMTQATGRQASTLHRLLGYRPTRTVDCEHCREASSGFDYSEFSGDDVHTVVVDESSMVDIELAAALMTKAVNCRLIFVGDHNQLPPVGPGQPFQDALSIAPSRCCATLTQVHRSKGEWMKAAAPMVLAGDMPPLNPGPGFLFIETALADDVVPAMQRLVNGEYNTAELNFAEIEAANASMPVVLSPQRKGPAGVNALNQYLHDHLNPVEPEVSLSIEMEDGNVIREGSWVMFQKNNARKGVCNGDTGKVLELVPSPKDAAKVGRVVVSVDADTADASTTTVDISVGEAREQLRLAYASTIHKAQGMEYPWVIVVAHSSHARMLTRRLLYTAITRAKLGVIIIGDRGGLQSAVGNAREVTRNTSLIYRLAQCAHMQDG